MYPRVHISVMKIANINFVKVYRIDTDMYFFLKSLKFIH